MFSFSGLVGLGACFLEASSLHDTNLNTLSTKTPGAKNCWDILKKSGKSKILAMFFFIAYEKGFKFHTQPQTGAYSCLYSCDRSYPKLLNPSILYCTNF